MLNIPGRQFDTREGFVDFLGFGGLMLKKEAWQRVGGCDERFFYGFEDTDWCKRASGKGVKLYYYPKAYSLHLLHQSVKANSGRQVEFYLSEVYYYGKHHGALAAMSVRSLIIVFCCLRICVSFFRPQGASKRKTLGRLLKKLIFFRA